MPKQVLALSPEDFFNRLNRLLVTNPPEPDDPKTMARLATLGLHWCDVSHRCVHAGGALRRLRPASPTG